MDKIITLNLSDAAMLAAAIDNAVTSGRTVRVAIQGNALVYKIGEGMWSPPMGEWDKTSGAYIRAHTTVTRYEVIDNVTDAAASKAYDTLEGAEGICSSMNMDAYHRGCGGQYGIRPVTQTLDA